MSEPMVLYLDDTMYHVSVEFPSIKRKFEITEGQNGGTSILGKHIRDILGTTYEYTFTVRSDPSYPTDYDSFFEQIRNPVETHTLILPYGQSNMTLTCYIESGEDTYQGYWSGYKRWDELSITARSIAPITTSTPVTPDFNKWTLGGSY